MEYNSTNVIKFIDCFINAFIHKNKGFHNREDINIIPRPRYEKINVQISCKNMITFLDEDIFKDKLQVCDMTFEFIRLECYNVKADKGMFEECYLKLYFIKTGENNTDERDSNS